MNEPVTVIQAKLFRSNYDTLKSFTLFVAVKIIAKLNPEHRGKFEIKI